MLALAFALGLFLLPLVVIRFPELKQQYQGWVHVLSKDQALQYGYSVSGWLHTWFNFNPGKNLITAIGILLFIIPLLRYKMFVLFDFRLLALSSILLWIVIFNHMAESPTYIIALAGASVWYFSRARMWPDTLLFILVFAFASLSTTDLVPHAVRRDLFRPYVLKAVPCIILWLRIVWEMCFMEFRPANQDTLQLA